MSVWNPENIRDVAEANGIANLNSEVVDYVTRDVEFRLGQVIEKALKFMTHAKRTTMHTQDISLALRTLDVEPLYGYDSTRPLRFGEATIGAGQPLFFVEDEEVEFEKLINAPLPKVPRDITFTAHWLAVEGVQPSIPQNPSNGDAKMAAMIPKGAANSSMAAIAGLDSVNAQVKPAVRHVLSKELHLYFDRVSMAVFDTNNEVFRNAAFSSLRSDPGLRQLVPYFVHLVAEKVTHNINNLFILHQSCAILEALTANPNLYLDPYVHAMIPPVFTCLTSKHLGGAGSPAELAVCQLQTHYDLRDYAASLVATIARKYSSTNKTLKPRLARSCLRNWLDPLKTLGTNYGGLIGTVALGGVEVISHVIFPNLPLYDTILQEALNDKTKRADVEAVVVAITKSLQLLAESEGRAGAAAVNGSGGSAEDVDMTSTLKDMLAERAGEVVARRLCELQERPEWASVVDFVLKADVSKP